MTRRPPAPGRAALLGLLIVGGLGACTRPNPGFFDTDLTVGGATSDPDTTAGPTSSDSSTSTTEPGTGSESSVSSASTSSSASSTGPGSSSGPEPFCGDGVINDGEECDDGNDKELDECTSDCTSNPRAVVPVDPHAKLSAIGASNADVFEDDCPPEMFFVGVGVEEDNQNALLYRMRPYCAPLEIVPVDEVFTVRRGDLVPGEWRGGDGGMDIMDSLALCPDDQIVIGYTGLTNLLLSQITVHCAEVTLIGNGGYSLSVTVTGDTATAGKNVGMDAPHEYCEDTQIITQTTIWANNAVAGFAAACQSIKVAFYNE